MPRRASLIRKLRAKDASLVIVDSGNLTSSGDLAQQQEQIKKIADSYKLIGYDAVGVGSIDLQVEDTFYHVFCDRGVPIVQVDTVAHEQVQPYIIKKVDGLKVGIVSFGAVGANRAETVKLLKARYEAFKEAQEPERHIWLSPSPEI